MEMMKYRRNLYKKYGVDLSKYTTDIEAFNDTTTEFWELESTALKGNPDNSFDRRKWNPVTNKYDYYPSKSKHYTLVDPDVKDRKSIQYQPEKRGFVLFRNKNSNQWEFPTIPLIKGDTFLNAKEKLYLTLARERYQVLFPAHNCFTCVTRDFYEHERADPKNKGLVGVRTYYYKGYHIRGLIDLLECDVHPYNDFMFATKNDLNKIFGESYYKAIINSLTMY